MEKIIITYPNEITYYVFKQDGIYQNGIVYPTQEMASTGDDLETFTDYQTYINRINELSIL